MDENILLSIVIAVYNTEKYLERCLRSILSQEDGEVEIILIDDGSTDHSPKICDHYAEIDSRVKVIHKENGGQSSVRNIGIEVARGKYLWYVDSDDWIAEGTLKILIGNIKQYVPDVLLIGYKSCTEYKNTSLEVDQYNAYIIDSYRVLGELLSAKIQSYAWDRVVKRDIYLSNSITFPEGRIYEDTATMYKVLINANLVMRVDADIYQYFQRVESATKVFTKKTLLDLYMAIDDVISGVSKQCENNEYLKKRFQMFAMNMYIQLYVLIKRVLDINMDEELKKMLLVVTKKIEMNNIEWKMLGEFKEYAMYRNYLLYKLGILDVFLKWHGIIRRK